MKRLAILLLLPVFFVMSGFKSNDFIKWLDFNAKREVMNASVKKHKEFLNNGVVDLGTCEILAYVALKNGNKFNIKSDNARIKKLAPDDIYFVSKNKYFVYYCDCFHAVLDGIIDKNTGNTIGFSPIGKGHWYNHFNDFGNSRGFGYKRKHLGNDLFGSVGAPIIAVEGGTITELGWNMYGGWRVGIRSDDTKRYYYLLATACPCPHAHKSRVLR